MSLIEIIMSSGKSSVDIALYTLLPVMVVMLCVMKILEAKGIMETIVGWMARFLKPFGLTGMSSFALIQINFISFAAPLATLSIMNKRGVSDRHLTATLAMVLAMGQGNVLYPMIPLGLNWTAVITISIIGGLSASALTWHCLGRKLSSSESVTSEERLTEEHETRGIIGLINDAGTDAIRLAIGAIPMLTLSITIVGLLKAVGAVAALEHLLSPLLELAHISPMFVMPTLAKYLGGGTAYLGIISDLIYQGKITANQINTSAGFLIHAFDLPGIGIFLGISHRFTRLFIYAAPGALFGILIRTLLHFMLF